MLALRPTTAWLASLGGAIVACALAVVALHAHAPSQGARHARSAPGPQTTMVVTADGVKLGSAATSRPVSPGVPVDPEADQGFAVPAASVRTAAAPAPATVASRVSPGAPTDEQVKRELAEMRQATGDGTTAPGRRAAVTDGGRAVAPAGAPDVVRRVIAGGNAIADFPYIWGGGHGSFTDNGYDCSGSVSYALAAGGLLHAPLASGALERWGEPGPGRWITVYANAGHTFMYVAGLRFDTSGRSGPRGSRWQTAPRSLAGFEVRHFPGL
jgi:cell wall-associated NlpC family hydrolase